MLLAGDAGYSVGMTYVALIRGLNVGGHAVIRMDALKALFAEQGFPDTVTVGTSGNVMFQFSGSAETAVRRIEAALAKVLVREVHVLVRSRDDLRRLVASDPFKGVKTTPNAKLVVTFLEGEPKVALKLPYVEENARIVMITDGAAFSTYERGAKGAAFMGILEKAFGKSITTRTWDVVRKLALS